MSASRAGAVWWRHRPNRQMTIDRREPVPVNAIGHGRTTTYDKLTDWQRRKFDAQFTAWRAACNLTEVYTDAASYGIRVPDGNTGHHNPVDAWLTARRAWETYR